MEDNFVLVKWSMDWADEFDTDGFLITKEDNWQLYMSSLTCKEDIDSLYFGTNEGFEDLSVDEYKSAFTITKITGEEKSMLQNFFGYGKDKQVCYGIIPLARGKEYNEHWKDDLDISKILFDY
jgi:hypothetical protein